MKILLLGCKGQVGWELQRSLAPLGDLVACDFDTPGELKADFSDGAALADCDTLLIATPAQSLRAVMGSLAPHLAAGARGVITAKGIEQSSGRFLVDVLGEVAPGLEPLVLSGPSFAGDVARGFGDRDLAPDARVQKYVAPVAVGLHGQGLFAPANAQHGRVAVARTQDGVGTHGGIVLTVNPVFARDGGRLQQALQCPRGV